MKNFLAVIAGLFLGSLVNMGIIMLSNILIPAPAGADVTTYEGLKASMPLFQWQHFILPFAAHALGTLVGALAACYLAISHRLICSIIVGVFFLLGGITNAFLLPVPIWFNIVDLVGAYIPVSYLGYQIVSIHQISNALGEKSNPI